MIAIDEYRLCIVNLVAVGIKVVNFTVVVVGFKGILTVDLAVKIADFN
jgi:hypothetical protein